MYIHKITCIQNYRNLSGQQLLFDANVNYLIGENNIGKTNILELLHCFFSTGKFSDSDFLDTTKPIEICLCIEYSDDEIGFFEDCFDVEQRNSITIRGIQTNVDDRITYYHDTPCQPIIPSTTMKKLNTLYYYAQRMPSKEIDFRKTNGSGKVLNFLIQHSMDTSGITEQDVIKEDVVSNIVDSINQQISKLNLLAGDAISAYYDNEPGKVLCRVLGLGDPDGRDLTSLGEGIQYAFSIVLQIVETIYNVKSTRKPEDFEKRLVSVCDKTLFPLFLILDEPEIHQHPYRQRSIIKKIMALMHNENSEFCNLLKQLFDIDGIIGQVFIATHSPNIISHDYKQFIRLTKKQGEVRIYCGNTLNLENTKMYKHMLHSFPYFKEAMFSRAILFVEGDTENGAFPILAARLGYELDDLGIGIVKLDGADSVTPCMELFSKFGILAKAILDKDKLATYQGKDGVFFTDGVDFEEDMYDSFNLQDYIACMTEMEPERCFIGMLKKNGVAVEPLGAHQSVDWNTITNETQKSIMVSEKTKQLQTLRGSKNAAKGSFLATYVTNVPKSYSDVLSALMEGVKHYD